MKKILPLLIGTSLSGLCATATAEDLLQIYQQAKVSDSSILQAAATRDVAFAAIDIDRAVLLPQINLSAGYNLVRNNEASATQGPYNTNTFNAGVSLNQEIFNRTSWINLDLSEIAARQADAVYSSAQQDLILRVANTYFDVLRAMDDLEFIRAEKAAVGRQLEQTKQRFEVGLSAITDVHEAQAQYDSVLAQEILAENALTNSYEGIRLITGKEYKQLSVLNTENFTASRPEKKADELLVQAQEQNLSLLASRISQDFSKQSIKLAQTGHLPTVSLNAGYNMTNVSNKTNSTLGTDNNQLTGGINLQLPLYSGGGVSAQVEQAKFNYISASEVLEGVYRTTMRDVRAFYNNINASIGSLHAFEQTVISARSALEATEAGFEVGTRTIVDVLDSTRRLYDANRSLSDARYDYLINVLQLNQAVGVLSEQDIVDINKGLVNK